MPRGIYKRPITKQAKAKWDKEPDRQMHAELQRQWDKLSLANEFMQQALNEITRIMERHAAARKV